MGFSVDELVVAREAYTPDGALTEVGRTHFKEMRRYTNAAWRSVVIRAWLWLVVLELPALGLLIWSTFVGYDDAEDLRSTALLLGGAFLLGWALFAVPLIKDASANRRAVYLYIGWCKRELPAVAAMPDAEYERLYRSTVARQRGKNVGKRIGKGVISALSTVAGLPVSGFLDN